MQIICEPGDVAEGFRSSFESGDTGADIAERNVDRQRKVFHGGGLAGTGEDRGVRATCLEICGEFFHPLELFCIGDRRDAFGSDIKLTSNLSGKSGDHARSDAQAVICHAAGEGERRLHRVEAVHRACIGLGFVTLSFGLPTIEKRNVRPLWIRACEIAVERKNAVGFREIRHELHTLAEDRVVIRGKRLVLIKFRVLVFPEFGDQAEAGRALIGTEDVTDLRRLILCEPGENSLKRRAFRCLAGLEEFPRAGGRVEVENRGLGEGIRAFVVRMQAV